ncbi:hypothetical protein MPNT_300010 [Candidatus Methylacidithermus pantelleriae]|uniref:Uncharacterized protein n=1 Tax=Candidatus Methylacidithermus pantelleriae TaxID=2744239 RepID=A0A8J2BNU6_9BACT|nr:hypothetical protein MPNT_300010 [Candidatus Methylacidithermus pantelleriae]
MCCVEAVVDGTRCYGTENVRTMLSVFLSEKTEWVIGWCFITLLIEKSRRKRCQKGWWQEEDGSMAEPRLMALVRKLREKGKCSGRRVRWKRCESIVLGVCLKCG